MTIDRDPPVDGRNPLVPPDVVARTRLGRWWLHARLRTKLVAIVALIVAVWMVPIGVTLAVNARLSDARADAREINVKAEDLEALDEGVLDAVASAQDYFAQGLVDVAPVEEYRTKIADTPEDLAELRDGLPADLAPQVQELELAIDALADDYARSLDFGPAGSQPANVSLDPTFYRLNPTLVELLATTAASRVTYEEVVDGIEATLREDLEAARQESDRRQRHVVWATVGTMAAALVIAVGCTALLVSRVVGRIELLTGNADRFIRREPLLPSPASADEIGELTDKMLFAGELLDARRHEAVIATRAKDEFLARVSHELKTPLTAMIGFAQLLEEDPDLSPQGREDTDRIVREGHHLHELIEELLDIKAIEAGKVAMAVEPVALDEVVDEAVALVRATGAARTITIAADRPDDLTMAADRRRLGEVVFNLLANAVRYSDREGRVDLAAAPRGDMVRISVTDTGPGISPADQERLFEPFERLDAVPRHVEGTGVALALSKHVVEAMGGAIGVESTPGHGTTVWVDLPRPGTKTGAPQESDTAIPSDASVTAVGPRPAERSSAPAAAAADATTSRRPTRPPAPAVGARTRVGRWWLDAPLRRKLLVVAVLIVLVLLPPIGVAVAVNDRLADAIAERRLTSEKIEQLDALQRSIQDAATPMQSYQVLGLSDQQLVEDYRAAAQQIPVELATLRDGLPDDLRPPADDLETAIDEFTAALDELATVGAERTVDPTLPSQPGVFAYDPRLVEVLLASVTTTNTVNDRVRALEERAEERLAENRQAIGRSQQVLVWSTLGSMGAALLVAAIGTYIVTNGVVRRIELLSENANRFMRREPLLPTPASADEIGQLTDKMLYAGELLDARRAEAVAATRAKDEFLSRVSHELKTPLAAMIELSGALEADPDLSPESHSDAARIVRAGRHLHELIEELLDIKAIEAGERAISIEPVSIPEVADDAIELVRSMPASSSITITADCAADAIASADPRRIREVLLNLLSNAVKYNRPGGAVDLVARRQGDTVRVSVTDTGPGISAADQRKLFKPFERLAAGGTDVEGSGIGLALTKHVVQAMDGDIGIDSEPGHGATFWFTLPAADAPGRDRSRARQQTTRAGT